VTTGLAWIGLVLTACIVSTTAGDKRAGCGNAILRGSGREPDGCDCSVTDMMKGVDGVGYGVVDEP
jgi:hypothetical protein